MGNAWDLPEPLRRGPFTAAYANTFGVGEDRLRGARVTQLHHGVWIDSQAELTVPVRAEAALMACPEDAWISHATAAHLLGLRLPPRLRELGPIDVTVPSPKHAPRGPGFRGRQRFLDASGLQLAHGLQVVTAAQAFVDGADYLSLPELVALGDGIVDLRSPTATPAALRDAVSRHRGQRHHRRLCAASALIQPTSRSWVESVTRLELRALGIHDAWWNVPVRLPGGEEISPDAAFWRSGALLEIEGDQHRSDRQQWLKDLDRYNLVQQYGLHPLRLVVTSPSETRERLERILHRVRALDDPNRQAPPIAPWYRHPPVYPERWLLTA